MESIRRVRKHLGMTLAQVAEKTGLSISFLSDLERGRTDPSLSTLRKISLCYGISVPHLLEAYEKEDETSKALYDQQHLLNIQKILVMLFRVPGVIAVEVEDNDASGEWQKRAFVMFAGCDEPVGIELF